MRGNIYQLSLIVLGAISIGLFGVFLYRELYPEYKIYQKDYVALEEFHSSLIKEPAPIFKFGVKQIVMEREDRGPANIDRCISCHVALQIDYFSPTKIERDINGKIVLDEKGFPLKVPNENFIWAKLDQRILELSDEKVIEQMRLNGENSKAEKFLEEASYLRSLKTVKVGEHTYDVSKVLAMHPLIGKETRPFEFHPIEEYGCVSCHSGNGRALTTDKAHGPVFDGQYEAEFLGYKPKFTEIDVYNDPSFSRVFNEKPGHALLFQTTPLFVGSLIQAKCIQCHQTSREAMLFSEESMHSIKELKKKQSFILKNTFENEKERLLSLIKINNLINLEGLDKTLKFLKKESKNYQLSPLQLEKNASQLRYLEEHSKESEEKLEKNIQKEIDYIIGSKALSLQLKDATDLDQINVFIEKNKNTPQATGTLFQKAAAWDLQKEMQKHEIEKTEFSENTENDQPFMNAAALDIDFLTKNYQHGKELFLSQACYACHRISGFARGGVGPELTKEGNSYPWFIKESIVWPQADLATSTMPNYKLDHEELEDLMTFLLGQKDESQTISATAKKIAYQQWEGGKKLPWEEPVPPNKQHDLNFSMTVFAVEGCAACHRLKGYESDVGFAIEKNKEIDFETLQKEKNWFQELFPEEILGSEIILAADVNQKEIDERILDNVRENSLIEEIMQKHPGHIEAFYTNFRFAMRGKNHEYSEKIRKEPEKRQELEKELLQYKNRITKILKMYIQEYGLGRLICPRPDWSGVFRSDQWLIEHFKNPTSHVPRSIMPIFPFDETKFTSLTYMLDVLGKRNRDKVQKIWNLEGFNPADAVEMFCSQCHGSLLQGNGPVSEWIYPIPKNLRNADFLRNLTKQRVVDSIIHGVKGTPMPPFGEVALDKVANDNKPVITRDQAELIADWLFHNLGGAEVIRGEKDILKWQYGPKDILKDLKKEGNILKGKEEAFLDYKKESLYASLEAVTPANLDSVSEVFDVIPNPSSTSEKNFYYIKRKFYTKENIEKGMDFFEMNCAVCHGKEADGTGIRGQIMEDAKPRILTNLDWLHTRDDLRLIRSIKFGVPGTSMTPWGDMTSSLQRLQLVIYIRSLVEQSEKKRKLANQLYETFQTQNHKIELERIEEYQHLRTLQKELKKIEEKKIEAEKEQNQEEATKAYQLIFTLKQQISEAEKKDLQYQKMKALISEEINLYQDLGNDLLFKDLGSPIENSFLELMNVKKNQEQRKELQNLIIKHLDETLLDKQKEQSYQKAKFSSEKLNLLNTEIKSLMNLRNRTVSTFSRDLELRKELENLEKK